jgi:hypothetical protein
VAEGTPSSTATTQTKLAKIAVHSSPPCTEQCGALPPRSGKEREHRQPEHVAAYEHAGAVIGVEPRQLRSRAGTSPAARRRRQAPIDLAKVVRDIDEYWRTRGCCLQIYSA